MIQTRLPSRLCALIATFFLSTLGPLVWPDRTKELTVRLQVLKPPLTLIVPA